MIVSNKVPFGKKGFKNFVGYKDVKNVRPLCLMLPKMSAYSKKFAETTYMSFSIKKWRFPEKI